MKKKIDKRTRIVIIIICILLLGFASYNVFWYVSTHNKYDTYSRGMEKGIKGSYVQISTENNPYNLTIMYPSYLAFNDGSLAINNNKNVSLMIWPEVFSDYIEYGLRIETENDGYEIFLNEKGEIDKTLYSEEEYVFVKGIFEEYKVDIEKIYKKARELWDVL